jgi:hypothetical protein
MQNQETQGQNTNDKMEEKETRTVVEEHWQNGFSAEDDDVTRNKMEQGSPSLTKHKTETTEMPDQVKTMDNSSCHTGNKHNNTTKKEYTLKLQTKIPKGYKKNPLDLLLKMVLEMFAADECFKVRVYDKTSIAWPIADTNDIPVDDEQLK